MTWTRLMAATLCAGWMVVMDPGHVRAQGDEGDDMDELVEEDDGGFVMNQGEAAVLLREGLRLAADDEHLSASLRFDGILQDARPGFPEVKEARFALGVSLYELGLHQSALLHFEPVVDEGIEHPKYRKALPYLLFISRATDAEASVSSKIASYAPEVYPPDFRDELHFVVGQHFYGEGSYQDALARFQQVTDGQGEFFVRARYLEGVIHVQESHLDTDPEHADQGRLKQAADAFKAVLRYQRDRGGDPTVDKVAAMANLALGRLFFSTRQYQVAVRLYDRVSETDRDWLDALFEVSWVYFQLKQYPRALGNLHTLTSPFFADQYFPESRVLQALILFYNCRYDEADEVIRGFVKEYYPLMKELAAQMTQFEDPNAFYRWLARLSKQDASEFSARFTLIFNAALADRKLRRKFYFVANVNRELSRLDALAKDEPAAEPFLQSLNAELAGYRSLVVGEAGSLAQARLMRVLKELKRHLAGALKIKGEILKARRGVQAPSIRAEQAAAAAARSEIVVDAEHVEWPFTGEYWRDELGSYIYDISSRCQVGSAGGQ